MKREAKKPVILPADLHQTAQPIGVFRWRANPEAEHTFKDVLDPAYWERVQKDKFKVVHDHHNGQVVEVYPKDGAYYAELLVERLRNGHLRIKQLMYVDLNEDQPTLSRDDFEVKLRGPKKWSIVRTRDGKVMEELIESKQQAEMVLEQMIG